MAITVERVRLFGFNNFPNVLIACLLVFDLAIKVIVFELELFDALSKFFYQGAWGMFSGVRGYINNSLILLK